MRGIIKAAAWIGHAKGDQHPYQHSSQPDVGVADTAQALIKIAHPSDSRYQARPALMMARTNVFEVLLFANKQDDPSRIVCPVALNTIKRL